MQILPESDTTIIIHKLLMKARNEEIFIPLRMHRFKFDIQTPRCTLEKSQIQRERDSNMD